MVHSGDGEVGRTERDEPARRPELRDGSPARAEGENDSAVYRTVAPRAAAQDAAASEHHSPVEQVITTVHGRQSERLVPAGWGRRAVVLGAIVLLVAGAALLAERWANGKLQTSVSSSLGAIHRTQLEALRIWHDGFVSRARGMRGSPTVVAAAREVGAATSEAERSKAMSFLAESLRERGVLDGVDGFLFVDAKGTHWAYSGATTRSGLDLRQRPEYRRALRGEVAFTQPIELPNGQSSGFDSEKTAVFLLVPIASGSEPGALVIGLRIDVNQALSQVLEIGRVGASGESVAFDEHGRLVTRSRFENELTELVGSRGGAIELREPGASLGESSRLTAPIRSLLGGRAGGAPTRWLDYRGHEVIGCWSRVPELDLDVITKVDTAEAFAVLDAMHWTNVVVIALLALAGLGLVAAWYFTLRLEARAAKFEALGQYRLFGKIGEGGMGTVYRAEHALLARPTAVKLLRVTTSATRRRFEREVRITAGLSHPNTVAVYDYGSTEFGTFYYAMELLDGTDLERRVLTDGPMPAGRAVHVVKQVLGSLAEAHEHGLVHRDIKPANVMLTTRGGILDFVKVLDFGVAHDESDINPRLTDERVLLGTPLYLAPELITGSAPASARSDIYAVGTLLFFLLTGREAFEGETVAAVARRHVVGARLRLQDVLGQGHAPPGVEELLDAWLSPELSRRPESARVALEQLEPLAERYPWTSADAHQASVTRIVVASPAVDAQGALLNQRDIPTLVENFERVRSGQPAVGPEGSERVGSTTRAAVPRPRKRR